MFVFAGLIPWTLFSQGYSLSAVSLVNQQNLLTKVYFPSAVRADRGRLSYSWSTWFFPWSSTRLCLLYYQCHAELDGHLSAAADPGDADRHAELRA